MIKVQLALASNIKKKKKQGLVLMFI